MTKNGAVSVQDLLKQIEQMREALSRSVILAESVIRLVDSQLGDMLVSDDLLGKQYDFLLLLSKGNPKPRDVAKFAKGAGFLLDSTESKLLTEAALASLIKEAMKLAQQKKVTSKVQKPKRVKETVKAEVPGRKQKAKAKGKRRLKRMDPYIPKILDAVLTGSTIPDDFSVALQTTYGGNWRDQKIGGVLKGEKLRGTTMGIDFDSAPNASFLRMNYLPSALRILRDAKVHPRKYYPYVVKLVKRTEDAGIGVDGLEKIFRTWGAVID